MRLRRGDWVEVKGVPASSPEYDVGEVRSAGHGEARVYWHVARKVYHEDPRALRVLHTVDAAHRVGPEFFH